MVGSILYGSGYVLVAFLEGWLVHDFGRLTQQQLLDAIALGQFTPGPVLTTATLIGYQLAGAAGAAVATVAIFLPSFALRLPLCENGPSRHRDAIGLSLFTARLQPYSTEKTGTENARKQEARQYAHSGNQ